MQEDLVTVEEKRKIQFKEFMDFTPKSSSLNVTEFALTLLIVSGSYLRLSKHHYVIILINHVAVVRFSFKSGDNEKHYDKTHTCLNYIRSAVSIDSVYTDKQQGGKKSIWKRIEGDKDNRSTEIASVQLDNSSAPYYCWTISNLIHSGKFSMID